MANTINKDIIFKEDVCSNYPDGKLPMLDFCVWGEEVEDPSRESGVRWSTRYGYYEKPMTSRLVMMEASAMSARTKISSLSQEVLRVMMRCDLLTQQRERAAHLTKLMAKLKRSGTQGMVQQ